MIIKNLDELLSHGNIEGRRVVLDIMETALAAPDPYENTKKVVRLDGSKLIIGNPEIDFIFVHKKDDHIYSLDTRKIKTQLNEMPINSPAGIRKVKENLKKTHK